MRPSMRVAMMDIRIVRMFVFQPFVPMGMRVGLAWRIIWGVFMLVVLIMKVPVFVSLLGMNVPMLVYLRYVQPHTSSH